MDASLSSSLARPARRSRSLAVRGLGLAAAGIWLAWAAGAPVAARAQTAPAATAPAAAPVPASLLDRLPRVQRNAPAGAAGSYAAVLKRAEARGRAGRADALWVELFYGDPAAKARAEEALRPSTGGAATTANGPEMAFLQFVAAFVQGQDRQMLQAALRLAELAPDDIATEVAVRTLSGQLENQGQELLNAVPELQRLLERPLRDPATVYMLGRSLLAAVHAPGVDLPEQRALRLAGRLPNWQLWGPFGDWENLDFDHRFAIENTIAASYPAEESGSDPTRRPVTFDSAGGPVRFPEDWGNRGVSFAVTYLHLDQPEPVEMRFYSSASFEVEINGETVMRNDRRGRYTPATQAAAVRLPAGWNRILVKLAGGQSRDFDLMLRPAAGPIFSAETQGPGATGKAGAPAAWQDAAVPPAHVALAAAPQRLAAPWTLATWSAQRLAQHPQDAVTLWVDGIRRMEDEDPEHARVELTQAAQLDPRATPVWLELAQAYGALPDASQSYMQSEIETAAQQALKTDPRAIRAHERLGHVYESEGKATAAAEQYAACSGKGFANCDWSAFHLAASKGWLPEAATALGYALVESGSDWGAIASGLEFYDSTGDAAKLEQWLRVLRADPRASGILGIYDLRHGHPAQAVPLFAQAVSFEPSSATMRRDYLNALLQSGDEKRAASASRQALRDFPYDTGIAAAAAEIALRQNPEQGLAQLRQTQARRGPLRREANFLARDKFWLPWYHSAKEILQNAPGTSQYPNASDILVFDQMVDRINPDSSQDQYIHQIYRVLNSAGIAAVGTVHITPGSDLIRVRTIKPDGTVLMPEHIGNMHDITMPGLEPGDYIEEEYVQHMPPSSVVPGAINNDEFFVFNSSKQPFNYSNYIVLTPPHYPLMIDQERFPSPPTVTHLADGYTARSWLIQKTRILVTEPHMPPEVNLVPKVWVSSRQNWNEISDYLSDHLFAVQRATPEMQAEAAKLTAGLATPVERANAIFRWVAANIQPGQASMLAPARQTFTDRNGSRQGVFMALLSAAHVPFQLVLTRGVTDDSSIKIPSLFEFQYPLIHVGPLAGPTAAPGTNPSGWYDLNGDFAHLGYISPSVRGALALVCPAHLADPASAPGARTQPAGQLASVFTHAPSFRSKLDGIRIAVRATVAQDGDASLHMQLEFRGPNGEEMRQALANQPSSSLPQIYQQLALANYPNAAASNGAVENLTDKTKPLIISIDAEVPNYVTVNGSGNGSSWDIEHLVSGVGLLSRYAPLPFRTHPLVIAGSSYEQTQVTVTLPARFGKVSLPAAAELSNRFGDFQSSYTRNGSQVTFHRSIELNANLIQPDHYAAFRSFAEAVDNHDRQRITGTVN